MVGVAQLVEHWVVASVVAGSSPVIHPRKDLKTGRLKASRFFCGHCHESHRNLSFSLQFVFTLEEYGNVHSVFS